MTVFVYFAISKTKTDVFIDIFTYRNLRKSTVFFNPSTTNQIFLIVIFVDNSGVAGGKERGSLPLIVIVNTNSVYIGRSMFTS